MDEEHILLGIREDYGVTRSLAHFVRLLGPARVGEPHGILEEQVQPVAEGDASVPYSVLLARGSRGAGLAGAEV